MIAIDFTCCSHAMIGDAKMCGWTGSAAAAAGREGAVGIAVVELIEIGLELRDILVVRREARLVVVNAAR